MVPSRLDIRSGPYTFTVTDAAMPHGRSKIIKTPSRILVLLLAIVVLQSCGSTSQAGNSTGSVSTLGPGEFSLCQYLGLAASSSEAGPIQNVPATPPIQSTAFTGKYPDIEFIPLYPGATVTVPDQFTVNSDGNILRLTADTDINSVLNFYRDTLPKNGWVATTELPLTSDKTRGAGGMFVWTDPTNTLPWGMKLGVGVDDAPNPKSKNDRTGILLVYKKFPSIGKGLATYFPASNMKTTCSENFFINFSVPDKSWEGTVQKSYLTTASPQEVSDWYSTALPQYAWWLRDDGTYSGTYQVVPSLDYLASHLEVKISSADGGGSKVELTQSIKRYIEPRLD